MLLGRNTGSSKKVQLSALERVSANVMVADNDRNIVYVNGALKDFLGSAEADIKQDLPSFCVDSLVGTNIDGFHKNPDHQKGMIAGMTGKHEATITVGGIAFDLIAQPLLDNGRRIGTLVEWRDAALRLENSDFRAQLEAIGQSQAVISFKPDGTIIAANNNFLAATGYTLNEIVGQHHRIFCERDYTSGPEYSAFWAKLGGGAYEAGEFKRLNKAGDVLWLSATYNPIFDDHGKVAKVVKFARDITEDVVSRQRRQQAQASINSDLGEISTAVSIANRQATDAAQAANETSQNVQTVASGLEELAASVNEINGRVSDASQISSRAATEASNGTDIFSGLSTAATEIENVVQLISDIAEQTNLLALNATIEAARAGEAGKGFAVVASEVKELASQTAKATQEISQKIGNVQDSTEKAVTAMESISGTINQINEITAAISAAVEEQSATTLEMSRNMQVAADGVSSINTNVGEIADATKLVDESTQKVKESASALG